MNAENPEQLGQMLHPLQDSFFHQDYGSRIGHLIPSALSYIFPFVHDPDNLSTRVEITVAAFQATFQVLKDKADEWGQNGIGKNSVFADIGGLFFRTLAVYDADYVNYDPQSDILTISATPTHVMGLADELAKQGYTVYVDGVCYAGC